MKQRKLKRILYSKPYLMDGLFVRSRDEAQQMALASTLRIDQVLLSIRQDPDISATTWARVDLALKANPHRESKQTTRGERTHDWSSNIKSRRRVVAVAAAMILVVAFFTLIPSGKTLAKDAFDYIMNVFGNQIKIEPAGHGPMHPTTIDDSEKNQEELVNEFGDVVLEYETLLDFQEEYGLVPIQLISERFDCIRITLTKYEASGISLSTLYTSAKGDIVITQKWLMSEGISVGSNSDMWESTSILEGVELLYAVDKDDGVFDGFALLNESIFWISAQPSVDIMNELCNLK